MTRFLSACSIVALCAGAAQAEMRFNRIASFATPQNMARGSDTNRESSAEIIAATADGMMLVYTDSPLEVLGRIDITDPANPKPLGNIAMGGEPTSVAVVGDLAIVAVNTSKSYAAPSGYVAAIRIPDGVEVSRCDLGGQPDSVAIARDGSFTAIAVENERDEDAGNGRVGQAPEGFVVLVGVKDGLDCAGLQRVAMTGLSEIAPDDPEPEFVDINGRGEIVVTMQENNHIAIVSRDGVILDHFTAGAVDLVNVDVKEEGALTFDAAQSGRLREPDGVKWLGDDHILIANEGDMDGGSRGWTVLSAKGDVVFESGMDFENAVVAIGHYPEERSGNKGIEPESVEVGMFDGVRLAFIGAERASVVGVYDMTDPSHPDLLQLLPSGIAPEGIVAIPQRNLLITANEADFIEDGGVRAHVMVYAWTEGPAAYPMLTSGGITMANGAPVGWGALSGLVSDRERRGRVYAVNDSFYAMQPTIFEIDTTVHPARIVRAIPVTRGGLPAQKLDMEGIALDGNGGFWVANEGRTDRMVPHGVLHVNAMGEIEEEIGLPASLLAVEKRFGFEGVTKIGTRLWMAVQREWADDPKGMVKLVSYDLESKEWGAVHYPLEGAQSGWVGLSEIVAHGDYVYLLERDNRIGEAARVKQVTRVPVSQLVPAALGGDLPVVTKEIVRNLLPDLKALNGYVQDKVEGLAITPDGTTWVVTDNDGVDDHSGETLFWSFGKI